MKHQLFVFIDVTVASGKKVCKNHIRGCRAQLDLDFKFTKCDVCREKERLRDQTLRAAAASAASQVTADATEKPCTTCRKVFSMNMFQGEKGITKTCRTCRDDNKKQDENRNREHRNALARIAEAKPERKKQKRESRKASILVKDI